MRNRKKKGPAGDSGNKPEPPASESVPAKETKDVQVDKEVPKPKQTSRLRRCAWFCIKLVLFLVVLAVLGVLFVIFVVPRIMSEMQVNIKTIYSQMVF